MAAPRPKSRIDPPSAAADPVAMLRADVVSLCEVVTGMATTLIETREDVATLAARLDRFEPTQKPPPGWLNLKRAAAVVGVGAEAMRRRAVRGTVVARRYGAQWFISPESL